MTPPVFFFRGLNTYGDDLMHLGPLSPGPIYGPLQQELEKNGVHFVPVTGMGSGDFATVLENARTSLMCNPTWQQSSSAHFLGHSMGALIARSLVQTPEIAAKVQSLTSYGSPHQGTTAADRIVNLQPQHKAMLKVLGWNPDVKIPMLSHLTPAAMQKFNHQTPNIDGVSYTSAVCATPYEDFTPAMKIIASVNGHKSIESDGMVSADSQRHGEVLGRFALDHITELGFFWDISMARKMRHHSEFVRLLKAFRQMWA